MKSRPSGAISTWAPAPGSYVGGREGSGGRQIGHHEIEVDTKLTAPKGPLFPLPPTERWQVPGRTKSACQSRGPATAGPQGAARPRARATRPGPRAEPVRPGGTGSPAGWGLAAGGWGPARAGGPRGGRGGRGRPVPPAGGRDAQRLRAGAGPGGGACRARPPHVSPVPGPAPRPVFITRDSRRDRPCSAACHRRPAHGKEPPARDPHSHASPRPPCPGPRRQSAEEAEGSAPRGLHLGGGRGARRPSLGPPRSGAARRDSRVPRGWGRARVCGPEGGWVGGRGPFWTSRL